MLYAQSALENVKLNESYSRLFASKEEAVAQAAEAEEKSKTMSTALEKAEHQRLIERTDRYESERQQWQRDRASLQECLKEMEEMDRRLSEADKRAYTLASEKRQLESARLKNLREAEEERNRVESALAKQRLEYEKRILDLEQAYERLKVNRDSISTSVDTLVTERSMVRMLRWSPCAARELVAMHTYVSAVR